MPWRSAKAGTPEYRSLWNRRRPGMTSAADIATPGGTIQRAHERSFLLLSMSAGRMRTYLPSWRGRCLLCK